jgi:hypothetical protein
VARTSTSAKKLDASPPSWNKLNYDSWKRELPVGDPDTDFILSGIKNGFNIIDDDVNIVEVEVPNHRSVCSGSHLYKEVNSQIMKEIENNNYIICKDKPLIVSPLGAIPKDEGGVRLIHDCSLPGGASVNDYASSPNKYSFESMDDVSKLIKPGDYIAKLDLKSAYRSVQINEWSQQVTGLKWNINGEDVYLRDTKLPFGSKLGPYIFNILSQAIKRIMYSKGYKRMTVYLDDFLCIGESFEECCNMLLDLLRLVRSLGFNVSYSKLVDPCQVLTFLGIEVSTIDCTFKLPQDKLDKLKGELIKFYNRKRASKRQLQQLVGLLNWASSVVHGGRVFFRRLLDLSNSLKGKNDKVILSVEAKKDIEWWYNFVKVFNGKAFCLEPQPITCVFTDACDHGSGATYNKDWYYCNWNIDWPCMANLHINCKEILAIMLAAWRWAPVWAGKHIRIYSDNITAAAAINKGRVNNSMIREGLYALFWLSAWFNFKITVKYIKGCENVQADLASRLNAKGNLTKLLDILQGPEYVLQHHMSVECANYISDKCV